MAKNDSKLEQLAHSEGFDDSLEMMQQYITDSVAPGICMNDGCSYTVQVEPDQCEGYCEQCGTNTVKSCMILAGVV